MKPLRCLCGRLPRWLDKCREDFGCPNDPVITDKECPAGSSVITFGYGNTPTASPPEIIAAWNGFIREARKRK